MSEQSEQLVGEPLQLIEFIRKDEKHSREIKLNEETLDHILRCCGQHPISIFCVCVPSRRGKSFLLGYIIRCLEAVEKGESDWMDWNNPKKPLTGFKFRNGVKPETQGIWVWSHPFILKGEDGKEVCVLLVDTQGTQDEFTTTQDMSAIVGLSLLTSSVMIFNFFTDLQEDTLVALNTYIQYGLLALQKSEDKEPPFQKLTFLIRDWNMPGDFPYGGKGGKRFLENKLQVKPDQSEEAKSLRRAIKKCFQQLDCFLLPHIGGRALLGNFKGSISDIDDKFSQKLEEFINGLINPEDLLIKEVLGTPVTSSELKSYLRMYVQTFNSEEIPSPSNMMEATAKLHNDLLIKKSVDTYKATLESKMRDKSFLSEEDLQAAHKSAQEAATNFFSKSKKFGNSEITQDLVQMMTDIFKGIKKQNDETRRRIIAEAINDTISLFKENLDKAFCFKNNTTFFTKVELIEKEKKLRDIVLEDFRNKISNGSLENVESHLEKLNLQLNDLKEGLVSKNKANHANAERKMEENIKKLVSAFQNKVEDHFSKNKFSDLDKLQDFRRQLTTATIELFQQIEKPGTNDFHQKYLQQLQESLEKAYKAAEDQLKISLKETWEKIITNLDDELNVYSADLLSFIKTEDCENFEALKEAHESKKNEVLEKILMTFAFPPESDYHKKVIELFEEKVDKVYDMVKAELERSLKKTEKYFQTTVQECMLFYATEMKSVTGGEDDFTRFLEENHLQEHHIRIKAKSIDKFHSDVSEISKRQDLLDSNLQKLSAKLEAMFQEIKKENENAFVKAKFEATNLVNDFHTQYQQLMKTKLNENVKTNKEELQAIHSSTKKSIFEMFGERCPTWSPDFVKNYLQTLEEKLENSYDTFVQGIENLQFKSEDSKKNALQIGIQHYKDGLKQIAHQLPLSNIIQEAHHRLFNESTELLQVHLLNSDSENKAEHINLALQKLQSKLEEIFQQTMKDVSEKRESAKLKASNLVNDCRNEYAKIMKKEGDLARTEDYLSEAHNRAKEKALKMFHDNCPTTDENSMRDFIETLEEGIEETFEESVELFELRLNEVETKCKGLLIDCREYYNQEMEKQLISQPQPFLRPIELRQLHQITMKVVLQKLEADEKDELTQFQIDTVAKEMDDLLQKFKIRNDMKLNYGKGIVPAIGIDLGTTYCCVGVFYQDKVIIIPNLEQGGNLTTPSYVAFSEDGDDVVVGEPAKENAYKNLESTIYDAKRLIGRKMDDKMLQRDIELWPFKVEEDEGVPKINVNGELLYPEQVSAKLLSYMKGMAEKYLKLEPGTIKKAVITVPAYFNDGQRQATVDAGKLAGLEVLTILNEPTAAAIAYSLERLDKTARKVLVYDLGGGTFDVAVLDMKPKEINVIGVDGDTHLGGEDFDRNLMIYCANQFKSQTGFDLFAEINSADKVKRNEAKEKIRRLQLNCEKYKKQLATARIAKVSIDSFVNGMDFNVDVTRMVFEELNDLEFQKTIEIVDRALKAVNVGKTDVDDIVLVGGSSRIPKVQEMIKSYFNGKALNHAIDPDLCVAYGAAVKAAMMNGEQAKKSLGLDIIQDVTPYSIGIEVYGGGFDILIPKNSKVPCTISKSNYGTTKDYQTSVSIVIFQGEDKIAAKNDLLGKFILGGIPSKKKGEERLEVMMEINSMGILHVMAVVESTRAVNSVTITENKQRMSKELIEKLVGESK